jgi:hypothetical protein
MISSMGLIADWSCIASLMFTLFVEGEFMLGGMLSGSYDCCLLHG